MAAKRKRKIVAAQRTQLTTDHAEYAVWRGKWRDRRGRWRDRHGHYTSAPRIPRSEWPAKRKSAPTRQEIALSRKRAAGAKQGWDTRRREAKKRSQRSKRGWKTRWFRQARHEAVDGLHGANRAHWITLRALIENNDALWLAFLERAAELGFSSRQARDEWFSPTL